MEINVTAVRLAMADKGMTIKQLAKAAHVSEYTAARYAKAGGNGTPTTLYKIGRALGVKPSSLVLVRQ